jgi:hypothetical protein
LPELRSWELYLRHYGRDGTLKNGLINPLFCRYTNSLDSDEPLVFALEADGYTQYTPIAEFDIVEVMIRNRFLGINDFVRDFVGIVRGGKPNRQTDEDGITSLVFAAAEGKHALSWRRVLWPAGVANRSTFTNQPAETIIKTLVTFNATAQASVANGRYRAGDLTPMEITPTVEADAGRGGNVSLSFAGANIMDALRRVCELADNYYTWEWQGGSFGGANEWAFTWGRGSDKSSGANRVLFSLKNNTLSRPRRTYRPARATVALAAGQGEGAERATAITNGRDFAADNDIETFVDGRIYSTTDGLIGVGQRRLQELEEQSDFDFDVLLTADTFYSPIPVTGRKTYHVGDIVLADYGELETRRIRRAIVTWQDGAGDSLTVSLETELWLN